MITSFESYSCAFHREKYCFMLSNSLFHVFVAIAHFCLRHCAQHINNNKYILYCFLILHVDWRI